MTVIVAAHTKRDGIVMAADSEVTAGWLTLTTSQKLWVDEDLGYIFGCAGSIRLAQLIRYYTEWPKYHEDECDAQKFGVTRVVPAIVKGLLTQNGLTNSNGVYSGDFELLMAGPFGIVEVGGDLSVLAHEGRAAIGSGESEAYGYLGDTGPWTKSKVTTAVQRASITAYGVGGAVHVVTTKALEVEKVE